MKVQAQATRAYLTPLRSEATRVFIGASRMRLRVEGSDVFLSGLPAILRQLNFIEVGEGRSAGPSDLRNVCLIDGALDGADELCRSLPVETAKIVATKISSFGDRQRWATAGADALINTPVDPQELSAWIEHFEDRRGSTRATVLIVDDDELSAEWIASLLAERGIDADYVVDPTRVFEMMERVSFDLVLMDLEMPEVNGIDLARMIRQDRRFLSIPIVFLSAGGDTETQIKARSFGGDDFISKRVDRGILARLIELRVERARVLRAMIERDGLTGLIDHARIVERVGQELARSRRTGARCTLVLIDIDHFKTVNDTWGHQTGDLVLRRLASGLSVWLRSTDVVGRYGGEEFAALMLDTDATSALPVIDEFRRHFSEIEIAAPDTTFRVTFSAGIAESFSAADTATLIAMADEALYRAKREGRDRVLVASGRPPPIATPFRSVPPIRDPANGDI